MKNSKLIEAIKSTVSIDSIAGGGHNSTHAIYWLDKGLKEGTIKLHAEENILSVELLGVKDLVRIPLPTVNMLGNEAISHLGALIAYILHTAISVTGKGTERYPAMYDNLLPLSLGYICESQYRKQTNIVISRAAAEASPIDYGFTPEQVTLLSLGDRIDFDTDRRNSRETITLTGPKEILINIFATPDYKTLIDIKGGWSIHALEKMHKANCIVKLSRPVV